MKLNTKLQMALLCGLLTAASTRADERFFTYVEDADVIPKGSWEFEQWLTFQKGYPGGDQDYDRYRWNFREEIEYGLTEKLSGALYLNFRQNSDIAQQPNLQSSSEFSFEGVSAELKYQLLNPNTKPIGLALYVEPTYNGNEVEMEEKIILSKNLGDKWVFAANAVFEQEWEREHGVTEEESVLEFGLGAAYRFTPNWSVGLEGRYHAVYEGSGFNKYLGAGWYVGPNVHYGTSKWWATLTILPQVAGNPSTGSPGLNTTENSTFETRLIFGINF